MANNFALPVRTIDNLQISDKMLNEIRKIIQDREFLNRKNNKNADSAMLDNLEDDFTDSAKLLKKDEEDHFSLIPEEDPRALNTTLLEVEQIDKETDSMVKNKVDEESALQENCEYLVNWSKNTSGNRENQGMIIEQTGNAFGDNSMSPQKANIIIIDTSSTGASSSYSSDPESKNSQKSYFYRKRSLNGMTMMGRALIASFEKLLLNELDESLIERYYRRYCSKTSDQLYFIASVCTSNKYNGDRKYSKKDIHQIHRRVQARNNRKIVQFLIEEIHNIVNKLKAKQNISQNKNKDSIANSDSTSQQRDKYQFKENKNSLRADSDRTAMTIEEEKSYIKHCVLKSILLLRKQFDNTAKSNEKYKFAKKRDVVNDNNRGARRTDDLHRSPRNVDFRDYMESISSQMRHESPEMRDDVHEIDLKLMELHKRHLFLDEIILKLQKDKLESDLQMIKLQNEKLMQLSVNTRKRNARSANLMSSYSTNQIKEEYLDSLGYYSADDRKFQSRNGSGRSSSPEIKRKANLSLFPENLSEKCYKNINDNKSVKKRSSRTQQRFFWQNREDSNLYRAD